MILLKNNKINRSYCLLLILLLFSFPSNAQSTINKLFLNEKLKDAELAIEFSQPINIIQGELPKSIDKPKRTYFDFQSTKLSQTDKRLIESTSRHLRIRFGQFDPSTVRMVIELLDDQKVSMTRSADGATLTFKVFTQKVFNPPVINPPPKPAVKETRPNPVMNSSAPIKIVIDPGHGGNDPGAIGRNQRVMEKDVTLAIAKRTRDMIQKELPKAKIYLTRDHDKTLSLNERTQFANNLGADLFISIHANSSNNLQAKGIETYYLNITHDRYAIRLAAMENAISEKDVSDLEFILADLNTSSNTEESMRVGSLVQSHVVNRTQSKWSDVKDLGLKYALFYVLLGAKMPSILVETSFISHKDEEKRLSNKKYQDDIAHGIAQGVKKFFSEKEARLAVAASK